MTVLIAYSPEKGGRSALAFGAVLAQARGEDVELVHVVVRTWHASPGNGDAEFRQWAAESADEATRTGVAELATLAPGVAVRTHHVESRSIAGAILDAVENLEPCVVVLGSGQDGALGQVTLGATANKIAHSSTVPVVVAPRGYRTVPLRRLVAAWSEADEPELLTEIATFGRASGLAVEAVTFGRYTDGMYPPEVGLEAEDEVFAAWSDEALGALRACAPAAGLDPNEDVAVAAGPDWRSAVDAVDWEPGDLLAMGSHGGGVIRRVFLGSTAAKIMRHSPVPVVVFPG
ncbi:universal stress protein [Serinibacter arcticus]|uniref:Universal stress protein n=1 Tax=Serinibacter arcticus TaxID=1655435 RepID=A0A2U1ZV32_9MICO|nr:universal stress protein [Serinibacter arcticus]PWD50821.1 universal stress protein [Serinibacter arcticus]